MSRTTRDVRAALAELRDEDSRRVLLIGPRCQAEKVRDVLCRIEFATAHPDRQEATAKAIAERHGDDATRWLLDLLNGIAADPSVDVPAILAHRLKNGLLDAAEQSTTTSSANGRPPRPAQHAAGAGDRAENARRRAEEHAQDPEGRLRGIVVARVFGDRALPEVIADELGVPVDRVASIVAEEENRREAKRRPAERRGPARRLGLVRDREAAIQDPKAALLAVYKEANRRPPTHVLEALAAGGGT